MRDWTDAHEVSSRLAGRGELLRVFLGLGHPKVAHVDGRELFSRISIVLECGFVDVDHFHRLDIAEPQRHGTALEQATVITFCLSLELSTERSSRCLDIR